MSNGEESQEPKKQISSSEFNEYQSLKIVQESKKEIISWARNRLSILTIVIAFLGFIGTNVLTYTVVRALTEEDIKEAQRAVIFAETSAKIVQIEMQKATEQAKMAIEQAKDYSKSVEGLKVDADKLRKAYDELNSELLAKSENVREGADLKISQLELQIANLDDKISILAETTNILDTDRLVAPTPASSAPPQKAIERFVELQTAQTTLKENAMAKQAEFKENSLYNILIISYREDLYPIATNHLRGLGFIVAPAIRLEYPFKEIFYDIIGGQEDQFSDSKAFVTYGHMADRIKANFIANKLEEVGIEAVSIQMLFPITPVNPMHISIVIPKSINLFGNLQ